MKTKPEFLSKVFLTLSLLAVTAGAGVRFGRAQEEQPTSAGKGPFATFFAVHMEEAERLLDKAIELLEGDKPAPSEGGKSDPSEGGKPEQACRARLLVENPPESPFFKGGLQSFPPFLKGGLQSFPPFRKGGRGGISFGGYQQSSPTPPDQGEAGKPGSAEHGKPAPTKINWRWHGHLAHDSSRAGRPYHNSNPPGEGQEPATSEQASASREIQLRTAAAQVEVVSALPMGEKGAEMGDKRQFATTSRTSRAICCRSRTSRLRWTRC